MKIKNGTYQYILYTGLKFLATPLNSSLVSERLSLALYISQELRHLNHRIQKDTISKRNAIKRTLLFLAVRRMFFIKLRFYWSTVIYTVS